MPRLFLTRHGQSQWNLENRFTGWWDADLTPAGEDEATRGGALMRAAGFAPTRAFTSVQTRAIRTLWLSLAALDRAWIPVAAHWRLNERHYGGLTGLDKAQTLAQYGEAQVKLWRRGYDIAPPPLPPGSPYDTSADPRYAGIAVPRGESLKMTLERVLPYWSETIAPVLRGGEDTLIAAHGNSLRALMKHLFALSDAAITELEIPTGNPLAIELDSALRPLSVVYLDPARANPLPPLPAQSASPEPLANTKPA